MSDIVEVQENVRALPIQFSYHDYVEHKSGKRFIVRGGFVSGGVVFLKDKNDNTYRSDECRLIHEG